MVLPDVALVLKELQLPDEIVEKCMASLNLQAGDLHDSSPRNVRSGSFGQATSGLDLQHHTGLAHQHVADAITEMVQGLRGYATNLHDFAKDLRDRDEQAAADLTAAQRERLDEAHEQTSRTDYHDPSDGGR